MYYPKHVIVDERVKKEKFYKKIIRNIKNDPEIKYFSGEDIEILLSSEKTKEIRKDTLVLTQNKGKWLKPCPGTTGNYLCCNYFILNFATNCSMECTYCILNAYFQYSEMTVFCNLNAMFSELDKQMKLYSKNFMRIGTGEFTDSLCLDQITGFSREIVPYFAKSKNACLELKTKTIQIDNLLKMDPNNRIIVSWSMNSQSVTQKEEHGTVSLKKRIEAAKKCEQAGYLLGFHFDPIIIYNGWEKEYKQTVDMIFDSIKDHSRIVWISLGCLRYPPYLGEIIKNRFPESKLPYGEFILGNDNKMRYFKPKRIDVYQKMSSWIKNRCKDTVVYLCMESPSVWETALGKNVSNNKSIAEMLNKSAKKFICS